MKQYLPNEYIYCVSNWHHNDNKSPLCYGPLNLGPLLFNLKDIQVLIQCEGTDGLLKIKVADRTLLNPFKF